MNPDTSSSMLSGQPERTDGPTSDAPSRALVTARPLPSDALLIVPVHSAVLFPGTVLPLTVGSERARAAVQEAVRLEQPIGVLYQKAAEVDDPGPDDLHWVGTSAVVLRYVTTSLGAPIVRDTSSNIAATDAGTEASHAMRVTPRS